MKLLPLLLVHAAVSLCLAAGCSKPPVGVLYGPTRPITAKDYPDVLQTWTRSSKLYQGLDQKLFVTATFHAPEFRRAFAIAFPEIYGTGGEVTRRELVELTGDVEQYHNFFFSVFTPVRRWNDLDREDSIWRLTLISSNEVAVGTHEVIRIRADANLRAVYPYLDVFHEGYLVRFPRTDAMGQVVIDGATTDFRVRMASALGVAELVWHLEPMRNNPLGKRSVEAPSGDDTED